MSHGPYGRRTFGFTVAQSVRAFAFAANFGAAPPQAAALRQPAYSEHEACPQNCPRRKWRISGNRPILRAKATNDHSRLIEQIDPEAHWQADAPAQISFLKDKTAYEIVVLYEDEDHLARLLQPQEDTKYIFVVPNMGFANKLMLPDAPCLFATVEQTEAGTPKITFYST